MMPWNDLHILTSVSKALVNALIHNYIIIIIYFFLETLDRKYKGTRFLCIWSNSTL